MKKVYLILISFLYILGSRAQETDLSQKKQEDIDALKIAFISRELELTPEEAQKFWPVYNQYARELKSAIREETDDLDREEKVLNIRKKYRGEFVKVIGNQRVKRMFGAEKRFHQLLIRTIRNRQQNNINRPVMRPRR